MKKLLLIPAWILLFIFPESALLNSRAGASSRVILFLGDSLTAGYGLDPAQAFPALIQQKLSSWNRSFRVINAGLSGETSAGGLRRINWLMRQKFDVLVLGLGANDGLRGISPEVTRQNLQGIIDRTKNKYPNVKVVIAGMQIPPNLGKDYSDRFKQLFFELAEKNEAFLIPFLLQGVAGKPELNLPDGIHPTAEGHKVVAENVWSVLRSLLARHTGP